LIEEDNVLKEFINETQNKVEVAQDEIIDIEMLVDDTLDEYKQTIRKINEILNKKAAENGIT